MGMAEVNETKPVDGEIEAIKKQSAARMALIEAIQKKGSYWEALATSEAIAFARNPDDKDARDRAQRTILRADTSEKLAKEIIELVYKHWAIKGAS
jgi:hypothetical protein